MDLDPREPALPITFNGPHLSLADRMSRLSAFLDVPSPQSQAGLLTKAKPVETLSKQATTSSPLPTQRAALFNPHSSGAVGERGSADNNGMSRGERGHYSTAQSLDVKASVPARLRKPDSGTAASASASSLHFTPPPSPTPLEAMTQTQAPQPADLKAAHRLITKLTRYRPKGLNDGPMQLSQLVKFDVATFESAAAAFSTSPAPTPDQNSVANENPNSGTSTVRRPAQLPLLYLDQLAAVTAAYAAGQVRNPGFVDALADAALLQIKLSEDAQATASSVRRAAILKESQEQDAQDNRIDNVQMYSSRWNQSSRPGSGFGSGRLPAPVQHRAHGQLAGSRSSGSGMHDSDGRDSSSGGSNRLSVGLLRGISRASFGGRIALLRRNGWRKGGKPRQERRYPTLFRVSITVNTSDDLH